MRSKFMSAQAYKEGKESIEAQVTRLTAPITNEQKELLTAEQIIDLQIENIATLAGVAVSALDYGDKSPRQEGRIVEGKFHEAFGAFVKEHSETNQDAVILMRNAAMIIAGKKAEEVQNVTYFTASQRVARMEYLTWQMLNDNKVICPLSVRKEGRNQTLFSLIFQTPQPSMA